jgi:hypothetical protein
VGAVLGENHVKILLLAFEDYPVSPVGWRYAARAPQ